MARCRSFPARRQAARIEANNAAKNPSEHTSENPSKNTSNNAEIAVRMHFATVESALSLSALRNGCSDKAQT